MCKCECKCVEEEYSIGYMFFCVFCFLITAVGWVFYIFYEVQMQSAFQYIFSPGGAIFAVAFIVMFITYFVYTATNGENNEELKKAFERRLIEMPYEKFKEIRLSDEKFKEIIEARTEVTIGEPITTISVRLGNPYKIDALDFGKQEWFFKIDNIDIVIGVHNGIIINRVVAHNIPTLM